MDTASSCYECEDTEPIDFENNGILWLPPEPEKEEDEIEGNLFDDDGEETGEWQCLRTSSSFGSGISRSCDRSNEEHKNAIKNVVEGKLKALLAQQLQVENLLVGEEGDKESWLEIIMSLCWDSVTLLKPYTCKGGGMNPLGYVKIKCLASGRRSDSTLVNGVVCKKNVADRRMTSNLVKPRILILGGALESPNVWESIHTLRQQEKDYLETAVAKIDALHPDILLVEKSVSRNAQEYLLVKGILLVLNMKRPLLERIASCTGGEIVPSVDQLSSQKLGYCEKFYIRRSLEEHGPAEHDGKKLEKTLMYFEGCPKPLGCTVLLRGASGDELKKVKHIVQYGIFAASHLVLETSFLADEGASLPQLLSLAQVDGKQVTEEPASLQEEFSPSHPDIQSILVSLSSRCVWKGTVCERSHFFRIKYYGNFDKPLGRYLCDHLFDQDYRCRFCEMPSEAHVQCYTHCQGTLTISVKKLPEILLPGEKDGKIWMWHRCLRCPRINGFPPATRRRVMSDDAWCLSLGKFLELSLSNHGAASSVASCGHSLHRDCLRFYGFGKMVACFQYASIDVHSVYLPPSMLEYAAATIDNKTSQDDNQVHMSLVQEPETKVGPRYMFPVGVNDVVVPIYNDEPSSIISYALLSPDYLVQLSDETEKSKDPHSHNKTLHARVLFDNSLGKVKYNVICYYAKRFEDLRKICCPSEMDFVRSLSRCKNGENQSAKRNAFFAKTLDERFIIEQVTKTELESFLKFAPEYFKYLSESILSGQPTCLAKILGIYQVTTKNVEGGKELTMDLLVMENLFYGRNLTRFYDLKGSSRSRYNPDSSGNNKVLLDQNLMEAMPTSPIYVGNKAKRLLERAVWDDTAFLASIDVMDYSLLVGVDEEKHELVVGIINFMRQYTWVKQLETWVKSSGILGGPKNASPTIIPPNEYKKRFRKAMASYFLMVPDQWSPPTNTIIPHMPQADLAGENAQDSYLDESSPYSPGESLVDPNISEVASSSLGDKVHSLYWLVVNRVLHCIYG